MNADELDDAIFGIITDLEEALGDWCGVDEVWIPERLTATNSAYNKAKELYANLTVTNVEGGAQ